MSPCTYYERDLAPNLSNQVPVTTGVDDATHQHMATYTVAFGVSGTLSAGPTSTSASFPGPIQPRAMRRKSTICVTRRTTAAASFTARKNSADLATSLLSTIGSIGDRTGSSASVAVNSRSLGSGTRLYQARFTSGEWSGDLRALAVDTSGNVGSQVWSAKEQVKNQDWSTGRAILTRNGSRGIPFRWITSGANALTAAQMAGLNDNPVTTVVDNNNKGEARLNWLRGSTTDEGTGNNFRVRKDGFKLGDIVNSSPIFVGSPINLPDLETTPHSSFRSTYVKSPGDGLCRRQRRHAARLRRCDRPGKRSPTCRQCCFRRPALQHRRHSSASSPIRAMPTVITWTAPPRWETLTEPLPM